VFKVLVVAPSWIGDTLLAQPLFSLLHARHPGLALDVLAPAWTAPLIARMPEVRRAILSPFAHGELRIGERRRLAGELSREGYGQAIVLPNTFKAALVPWLAGIARRTGYLGECRWGLLNDIRKLDKSAVPLLAARYAGLAREPGESPAPPLPAVRLRIDEARRVATLRELGLDAKQPTVALCPGAEYGPAKRWPARHFAELARELAARGFGVWIVGSDKDSTVAGQIADSAAAGICIDLCGRTTLDQAIDVLASAAAVVSNDSGLMHVAAAVGRPLVALYGSSSPAYTPPLAPDAEIIRLDLPCSPCFKRTCPLHHFNCMNEILPARVLAAAHFARIGALKRSSVSDP
jgi:heptosyltransferase-2